MNQRQEQQLEQLKEATKHRDALLDIQSVLATKSGRSFIKYLFETLDVGELPEIGYPEALLMDRIGFLRAGSSIFKLVMEASPDITAQILAQISKDEHANQNDTV